MLTSFEKPQTDQDAVRQPALAPWQHTVFLVVVLGLWALYGAFHSRLAPSQFPILVRYTSGIVMQTLLVGTTLAGIYHRRTFVLGLFGQPSNRRIRTDFALGLGIYLVGALALITTRLILKLAPLHVMRQSDAVRAIMPLTIPQLAMWILVAITAGVCEEFIFRGYLQRQVTAWFGSIFAGIALPALLFGSLHLYQGIAAAIGITLLGVVYAICAARLGNLRSVMFAHALQDLLVGLVHFMRHT